MISVILDTDLGPDCDDAGALAVLNNLKNQGLANILGVAHCTSSINGAYTAMAINEWFGNRDIPVSQYEKEGFLCAQDTEKYTRHIAENYKKDKGVREFETPVHMYKRLFTQNDDITLICIGPLNNISDLLKSAPDDISPLSGVELMKKAVSRVIIMGGEFDRLEVPEFNIFCDIEAAQTVAALCPVGITYLGYEIGLQVISGMSLEFADENYPVKYAYSSYCGYDCGYPKYERPSWDLLTVLIAFEKFDSLFTVKDNCTVSFDEKGATVLAEGGKDSWIRSVESEKALECLEIMIK